MDKLVRLVQMSKRALDDTKKQLAEKDLAISKLTAKMKEGFAENQKIIEDQKKRIDVNTIFIICLVSKRRNQTN